LGFTRTSVVYATPSLTLGTANAAGSLASAIRSDSTLLTFDATLPDAITFGQSGAVGTATVASRRDHVHAMAANPVTTAAVLCRMSGNQTISNTTWTLLNFDEETFDTDGMHDNSTNNSRLTAQSAGYYWIYSLVSWSSAGTGGRTARILYNGSDVISNFTNDANASRDMTQRNGVLYYLAVNDYVEMQVYQNSGSSTSILDTAEWSPQFGAVEVV